MDTALSWPLPVLVVGNGPKTENRIPGGFQVRFNRVGHSSLEAEPAGRLWVNNGHQVGRRRAFVTEGVNAGAELEQGLAEQASRLNQALNCWPSTGLTTVAYLAPRIGELQVFRMPLLPSLSRPRRLGPRQPLTCAFHNWLGERRLALSGALGVAPWPSLQLPAPTASDVAPCPEPELFERLMALPSQPRVFAEAELAALAATPLQVWLAQASRTRLTAAEPLFYLDRTCSNTRNWWLYDAAGSAQANAIVRALAWCQQSRFSPAAAAP